MTALEYGRNKMRRIMKLRYWVRLFFNTSRMSDMALTSLTAWLNIASRSPFVGLALTGVGGLQSLVIS